MKSMRSVSSNPGLGADCSRADTCGGGESAGDRHWLHPLRPPRPPASLVLCHAYHAHPYLLVVGPDQAEDEAAIHQGQQIAEEEGQAGVQALGQLCVLGAQGWSAHAHLSHPASVSTLGLALPRATSDLQEPRHCPKALGFSTHPHFCL